jgi:hypothetical protein
MRPQDFVALSVTGGNTGGESASTVGMNSGSAGAEAATGGPTATNSAVALVHSAGTTLAFLILGLAAVVFGHLAASVSVSVGKKAA